MTKRIVLISVILIMTGIIKTANADNQTNPKKQAALPQLESAFVADTTAMNFKSTPNPVNWPSDLDISINVAGQMTIQSKTAITISKIALTLDEVTIGDNPDLKVSPGNASKYSLNMHELLKSIGDSYKLLGISKQVSANDYPGYDRYNYRIIKATVDWTDSNNNFNQAATNFMLVVAK